MEAFSRDVSGVGVARNPVILSYFVGFIGFQGRSGVSWEEGRCRDRFSIMGLLHYFFGVVSKGL